MARGWTWINEDSPKIPSELEDGTENPEYTKMCMKADLLMDEWSTLREKDERRGWRRQAEYDGDCDVYEPDDEEEAMRHQLREEIEDKRINDRMLAIEEELHEMGLRSMRPYEHWNEDEQYMSWMECGRFGEDEGR